jgi:hypothetical protein
LLRERDAQLAVGTGVALRLSQWRQQECSDDERSKDFHGMISSLQLTSATIAAASSSIIGESSDKSPP